MSTGVMEYLREKAVYADELYPAAKGDLILRLARHIRVTDTGCWEWTGRASGKGYAQIRVGGARPVVHRVVWQVCNGPIPDGLQLDHLCRVRPCCNPEHLEPVTPRENTLRGEGVAARFASRTCCSLGHPFSPDNIYWRKGGGRECRTCALERARGRRR